MTSFELEILGHRERFSVTAYEPFEGAPFVAHRARGGRAWVVTHKGSTFIAAHPKDNTRKAALAIADKLSKACPSAVSVRLRKGADGQPIAGSVVGPHQKMRLEIVAAVDPRNAAA